MSAVRFCWLCEQPVPEDEGMPPPVDVHYETGRMIYFCGDEHWWMYANLASM